MVGIRTFLRRTWGRVWIYSFFALLLMIALSFIQHVIGGINWEAFQYPAEDGKPNVFVDDINHPSELTSLLVGDNHLYLFYGRIDVVKVYDWMDSTCTASTSATGATAAGQAISNVH